MPNREYMVRIADTMRVSLFPVRRKAHGKRGKRCKPTALQQERLNRKNSEHALSDMLGLNFTKHDCYLRLSYNDDHMPSCIKDAERHMQNYIKRVNYRRYKLGLPKLRYIYFTERGEKRGRIHHHLFLDGDMSRDEYEGIWGLGYANARRLQPGPDGLLGIAIYSAKGKRVMPDDEQPEGKHGKSYKCSLGLKRPEYGREIYQNDYRIKAHHALYIDEHPDDLRYIERLYPGYLVHTVETTPCDMRAPDPLTPIPRAHFITLYLYRADADFLNDRRIINGTNIRRRE